MPHPPTAACEAVHCAFHEEDEPTESSLAITCGECHHTFEDAVALIEADNAMRNRLDFDPRPLEHIEIIRAVIKGDDERLYEVVPCCPFCAHCF